MVDRDSNLTICINFYRQGSVVCQVVNERNDLEIWIGAISFFNVPSTGNICFKFLFALVLAHIMDHVFFLMFPKLCVNMSICILFVGWIMLLHSYL